MPALPQDADPEGKCSPGGSAGAASAAAARRRRNASYRRALVETASPAHLVLLLYDGAIRFCAQGEQAMAAHNYEAQNSSLQNAQQILWELTQSLRATHGTEVPGNLRRIYLHMIERLVMANLTDDLEAVQSVRSLLTSLREAWADVEKRLAGAGEPGDVTTGASAAPSREASQLREWAA